MPALSAALSRLPAVHRNTPLHFHPPKKLPTSSHLHGIHPPSSLPSLRRCITPRLRRLLPTLFISISTASSSAGASLSPSTRGVPRLCRKPRNPVDAASTECSFLQPATPRFHRRPSPTVAISSALQFDPPIASQCRQQPWPLRPPLRPPRAAESPVWLQRESTSASSAIVPSAGASIAADTRDRVSLSEVVDEVGRLTAAQIPRNDRSSASSAGARSSGATCCSVTTGPSTQRMVASRCTAKSSDEPAQSPRRRTPPPNPRWASTRRRWSR